MFEPNAGTNKQRMGFTAFSNMENRAVWTRKIGEFKHTLEYRYENVWNSEYKVIKRFITDVAEHRANSFYIIDFSSGVKVTALASTGGNYNASVYDTQDFSATSGEGGNYVCLWNGTEKKFRIGILSSKDDDSSITFPQSTDYGNLASVLATHHVGAYPVYRVYLADDSEDFKTTGFVPLTYTASFAGPIKSGAVRFVQRDVK